MLKKLFVYISPFFLNAETGLYAIKLATYKDHANVKENISKLNLDLQQHVVVHKDNGLVYKILTKPSERETLETRLPLYRKVFKDAFITSVEAGKKEDRKIKLPEDTTDVGNKSFYQQIQQKTFYACSHGKIAKGKKFIVKVMFGKEKVSYLPLRKEIPSIHVYYQIKNGHLYFYAEKKEIDHDMFNKLEKTTEKYLLISTWEKQKKLHTRRYYYHQKDAQKYLESL